MFIPTKVTIHDNSLKGTERREPAIRTMRPGASNEFHCLTIQDSVDIYLDLDGVKELHAVLDAWIITKNGEGKSR